MARKETHSSWKTSNQLTTVIIDKYTKTAWTILAISLFVISEIGFKNYQSSASNKGFIYTRHKKKK